MEEKIQYTFNDKFLSVENEKRINRRQWFNRSAVPGFLVTIPLIAIATILTTILININPFLVLFIPVFYNIAYGILIIKIMPNLIIKRCHDFNDNGIITKKIFFILFIVFVILVLLLITYIFTENLKLYDIFLPILNTFKIIITIFYLYLWLRPGTKGPNEYGDDTSNVKLGLLG